MKNAYIPRGARILILGIACLGLNGQVFAQKNTTTVDSTLVLADSQSQLPLDTQYPESVTDPAAAPPTATASPEELNMRVRVIGAKLSNSTSGGNAKSNSDQPVEVVWSKNKSAWSRIFYGSQSTVDPAAIVLDTVIARTDIIDFGARGYLSDWLPLYSTSSDCQNLVVLKNGDRTPPQIANKKNGQIAGFIKPYLSNNAQTVTIGDSQLLILVELDKTEPLAVGFDYQDLGLLISFE